MKTRTTVCARDCYDSCSLICTLDDAGQIVSMKGDPNHPHTQGFTCPRGAKDRIRLVTNRVEAPALSHAGDFKPTDWDTALDVVSRKLQDVLEQHGPKSILYLDYAGNAGILSETYPRRLWYALGVTQTDHSLCSNSGHTGLKLHYGASYGVVPEELMSMKLIVFWGFNAAVSSPHTWAIARKARKQHGAKIIVIDPVESKTAKLADMWLQPRPGTDVALAYGIMQYLFEHRYIEMSFIQGWTDGIEQLKAEAGQWNIDRVVQTTGVPLEKIERLGEAYSKLQPNASMLGIGLQKRDNGADQIRAASLVPALVSQPRGFFYSDSQAYSIDYDLISGKALTTEPLTVVPQVAIADLAQQGAFKCIIVNGMNPVMTLPNAQLFREALRRDDVFVVVHETHWSHTAHCADVVLPAPTYLEKDDLVIPWTHNLARLSPAIVPPVTDSRRETVLMQEFARRLGLEQPWLYDDPWEAIKPAFQQAFQKGDLDELRAGATLKLIRKPRAHYATPSGKIEFYSSVAENMGWNPLPQQQSLNQDAGQFILLNSAHSHYTHTQFQEVYGKIPAKVLINPHDARRLGIEQGQRVELSNEQATISVEADISEAVSEGVLWGTRQCEDLTGTPQNSLMSSTPQEIGNGPRFNSTRVTLCVGTSAF